MIKADAIFFTVRKILSCAIVITTALSLSSASNDTKLSSAFIQFIKPTPWTQIKSNTCSLSIAENPIIKSINFKAQYLPKNSQTPQIISLGDISRPPYKLIWDIAEIPNQLSYGITFFADIYLTNDKTIKRKQEGIFLIHHPVEPPVYKIPYAIKNEYNEKQESITLTSPSVTSNAFVNVSWNEKFLNVHIKVNNPHFCPIASDEKFKEFGVKICLDVQNQRNAYLSEDIELYVIPIDNKPYTITSRSVYEKDGSFDIVKKREACQCQSSVVTENFKGYTVSFSIPQKTSGFHAQQTIGCNIMATVIDENSDIKELSWITGNSYTVYSPFAYGELQLQKKPVLANKLYLWILCFIFGLFLGIIIVPAITITKKFNTLIKFESSEQEDMLLKNIITIIEAEITNKNFTVKDIASKLSITPAKVDRIIKRFYGKTFKKHLLCCRIEIVKERLRSSNASEISIANSCGFPSIDEMEKAFRTLNSMSPYKYREINRIS